MDHKSVSELVADEVAAELGRRRASQEDLAAHIGLSQATVSRRLKGIGSFTIEEIQSIADFLGIPIERLIRPALEAAA